MPNIACNSCYYLFLLHFGKFSHLTRCVYIRRVVQCRSKGNISGGTRERRRREPLEGSGGMLPQKILKSRSLEMPFPAFSKSYL